MKADSILATIGNTPHIRINRLFDHRIEVWFKQERANPGGSIKDRIALSMVEDAEARGEITPGRSVIVEPTSGNTGIALAWVAAAKGYRLIVVMPDGGRGFYCDAQEGYAYDAALAGDLVAHLMRHDRGDLLLGHLVLRLGRAGRCWWGGRAADGGDRTARR